WSAVGGGPVGWAGVGAPGAGRGATGVLGPGPAAGSPVGVPGGGAVAPAASHDARMRNCSRLSRPRVTGEENSTRSRRGEFSSTGINALAADAAPVNSTPFRSIHTVVSPP